MKLIRVVLLVSMLVHPLSVTSHGQPADSTESTIGGIEQAANLYATNATLTAPAAMTVGQSGEVVFRIVAKQNIPLKAHLTSDGFLITQLTPEELISSSQQPTEWRWKISPQRSGIMILGVTVSRGQM